VNTGGSSLLPLRVCFFGTYARGYTVSRILHRAVEQTAAEVIDCHEPLWERVAVKADSYFQVRSLVRLAVAYARAAHRLSHRLAGLGSADLYVVGFQGQLDLVLLRALLHRKRSPILFAPLVTLTETLVEDRHLFRPTSAQALLLRLLDRRALSAASRVLIDTHAHASYLQDRLEVPAGKISTWHLGCDGGVFRPAAGPDHGEQLRVLFYGSFLPLHGVESIVEAARRLRSQKEITFDLYGDGPMLAACQSAAAKSGLSNLHFYPWQPYESLGELIAQYDLCLGVFGSGRKSQMVIPNKIYQCAAVGRAIISADTPAVREVFSHGETIWLCRNDGGADLAEAVQELAGHPARRQRMAQQAQELMGSRFSTAEQARRIGSILAQTCSA
jgi:glycosyltransferase involved in cell wall biosynthesis